MDWLIDALITPSSVQVIIVICIVSAIGLELGKLKIFGISLGITFVFFTGIVVGHFDLGINKDMLLYAQNFGLIIFIYSLGLQVGPGFFSSLKRGGLRLNSLGMGVVVIGTLLMLLLAKITSVSLPNMMGLFMGAVTNTPALGAAQQAVVQISPDDAKTIADMALACAVTYPMGVVGVILAMIIIRKSIGLSKVGKGEKKSTDTFIAEFKITNPLIFGMTIYELMRSNELTFVISRIWSKGEVQVPKSNSVLNENDNLLIIATKSDVNKIAELLGQQVEADWNKDDIDWNAIDDSHLVSQNIIVTRKKINGVKMGALRLRNQYGINITRVNRAGIDLLPSPDLSLQIGDKLVVVGKINSLKKVADVLGDEVKKLKEPNLIAIFSGIALGLIVGAIPFPFPGMTMPIKLGIAAGPIIVGILMGAFGPRFKITTYATQSASLMMRRLGLVTYLACLGLSAGGNFFETVLQTEGLLWIAIGFLLTILPVLIVGFFAVKILKMDYETSVGMLCGSMANPIALDFVNTSIEGDEPSVAYATVYPVIMFARIVSAQILLLILL